MHSATQVSLHGGTACLCSGIQVHTGFQASRGLPAKSHRLLVTGTRCELRSRMVDFYVSSGWWSCPLPVQGPRPAGAFEIFRYKINRIGECLCVCVRDKEKVRGWLLLSELQSLDPLLGWLLLSELQSLDTLLGHCQSFQPRPLSDTKAEGGWVPKGKQLITPSWLSLYGFF